MPDTPAPDVSTLRTFNRSFTQRIGVLDDSFLQSGRPLAEARLLFEIGTDGASILELRHRLGLDSGYLSRLLRELERDRLVTALPDPDDARRRLVRLTAAGRSAWTELDRRSDELATGLLEPLSDDQRRRLDEALRSADRLLRVATLTFDVVDPRSDDALEAMAAYFAELAVRFSDGFDPGDTLTADAPAMRAPTGSFLVARSDGVVAACGGVQRHDDTTGEIKRMWVHPGWRGAGVGRRMLTHLEAQVATLGYTNVVLDTNDSLTEAITMYQRAGYRPIERYNDNPYAKCWFAKSLATA
ncbi:MAG: bifunctional helix-turn-helix transcriptional regulator/GNAT family N-acetyltransferase [Ilumatobacteraceae bacterium]|nr:bifunctional helix-turn-helix transcriptional regulator/GNAT family N-acetyltransferase [Ilumatobacteraceae bacterium]